MELTLRKAILRFALTAVALLASLASSSDAHRFNIENAINGFREIWTPLSFSAGGRTVRCNVTLAGEYLRRTNEKIAGLQLGNVLDARFNTCTGGSATVLVGTLPWSVHYAGFGGTLPNITSLRFTIRSLSLSIRPAESIACLARSTTESPARFIATVAFGSVTTVRADETATIPLEGFFCAFGGAGALSGTGAQLVREEGGLTRIFLI